MAFLSLQHAIPLSNILALKDFAPLAQRRLPRPIHGSVAGAAEDNVSLRRNQDAMNAHGFVPRVLVDVSQRTQQQSLFGTPYASPFGIAPMGLAALSAYQGDIALAKAAREAGIPAILSGSSLTTLEAVAQAAPGTWFQAYLPGDEVCIMALLQRARRARYEMLVVTVDIPVSQPREQRAQWVLHTPAAQPAAGVGRDLAPALAGGHLREDAVAPRHAAF